MNKLTKYSIEKHHHKFMKKLDFWSIPLNPPRGGHRRLPTMRGTGDGGGGGGLYLALGTKRARVWYDMR